MKGWPGNTRTRCSLVVCASIACGVIVPVTQSSPAFAQPSQGADARFADLKKRADEAYLSKRYDEALQLYRDALVIKADVKLRYNMGRTLEALGRYPEALVEYETFDAKAPADIKAKVPGLSDILADLQRKVTKLVIKCNVAGARVLIRDRALGTTPVDPTRVNAGPATIEILADGYKPFRKDIDLPGGTEHTLVAKLESKDASGVLIVHAPPGAMISVDGKRLGF